ncbi:hypothetical protein GCM10010492_26370 [Saccharothrix mutabilis subsp. mutabilis]|uniref:DUF3800 domain-containing protein n=1 Tax=Saccharothrix mutabilis subsp. mutabilis TaxID=66855 RepID=A0ABN0TPH3_9PSEU
MTVHAFVDESRRQDTYHLAAAVVHPRQLRQTRSQLRGLLFPGQRELHFKKETLPRKRLIVSTLCALGVEVGVYSASCRLGEERARQECLTRLARDLVGVGAMRLVLDSREGRDFRDRETIGRVLRKVGRDVPLTYEHVASQDEPLLWIADVAAWCHGAGQDWARRIEPVLGEVVGLDWP